jgi:IclR family transcriptional regulator, KDG regulon repressor
METTVVKGLRILEALAASDQPCGISEVARACGITKSNTHRLLKTLVDCRYVRQDPATRAYFLTLKLWELGTRVHNNLDLRRVAAPHLRALAAATEESVHLSVLDEGKVMYVDKIDSTQAVRAYVRAGDRAPAYCAATGKVMLAYQPDDVIDAATVEMKAFTPLTITTRQKLAADLARIRTRGYSLTRGEWRPGVLGIAAPIHSPAGPVVAAVGIAGPIERVKKADVTRLVEAVLVAARAISTDLGLGMHTNKPARVPRRRAGGGAPADRLAALPS